jgi:toxin ParE1/3/4
MAKLPVELHPAASFEKDSAFDWYYERSPQAANEFAAALEDARNAIQANPNSWADYLHGTRRYLIKRFTYVIVYRVSEVRIEILAVAHGRRRPGYWVDRL